MLLRIWLHLWPHSAPECLVWACSQHHGTQQTLRSTPCWQQSDGSLSGLWGLHTEEGLILLINKTWNLKSQEHRRDHCCSALHSSPSERDYPFHLVRTPLISPARFNSQNAPGRLAVFSFFLLVASLSPAPSLSNPPLRTWLPDLFYLSAGGNTNPSDSSSSSSSLMVFYKFTWQAAAPVFQGLKAARMCRKTRLRCIPLVKQVLSASNRLNFLFSHLMKSSSYASQDSGYWCLAAMRFSRVLFLRH